MGFGSALIIFSTLYSNIKGKTLNHRALLIIITERTTKIKSKTLTPNLKIISEIKWCNGALIKKILRLNVKKWGKVNTERMKKEKTENERTEREK